MSETPATERRHDIELRIEAPVERVWKALTDPEELTNWFPLRAEVRPGKGGEIVLDWGPELVGVCRIEVWEPNRRLRTTWFEQPEGSERKTPAGAGPQVIDYTLEDHGSHTVLRLVHSGFRAGDEWHHEYEGTGRGWKFELRGLRHYLERHPGESRRVVWARRSIQVSRDEAWRRLMSAKGLGGEGKLEGLVEGDRYALQTAAGDRLEGVVQVCDPPCDFAGTVENMDGALFRLGLEELAGLPEADLWLSTWGHPTDVEAIESRWHAMLRDLFPE